MNFAARSAFINGTQLDLTGTEFNLLCIFHKQIGSVLSRDEIGELLHGRKIDPLDRSIDTIVSRLRYKLSEHFQGKIIQSVRGKGYVLLLKKWQIFFDDLYSPAGKIDYHSMGACY